jgi:hypothetical protein
MRHELFALLKFESSLSHSYKKTALWLLFRMDALSGFEPEISDSESLVMPLHYRAISCFAACCSAYAVAFCFCFAIVPQLEWGANI